MQTMTVKFTTENLPTRFDFDEAQRELYRQWEEHGYFHSEPDPQREPFTIVMPPPNVTGALHLGHALNNTLQDVLIRMKRMQGFNALWMPGTDHAGIATQAVVERRLLEEEGKSRHDLGREGLVERIWAWKDAYEKRILSQLKQMGCSCDWQRTRFTLDDICARAVRQTFFDLFRKKWIYRGKRLVNWDTFLQTAVSDDEVFHETVPGHFWHIRYSVIEPQPGEPEYVTIATTRPETLLGDTAVAVHPDPEAALEQVEQNLQAKLEQAPEREREAIQGQLAEVRRRRREMLPGLVQLRDMALAGRKLRLPLLEREIPLIADSWAKPEMGSGCVKITPAHDPNDYEVGLRVGLPMINILNPEGTLNAQAGPYACLTIAEARRRVVEDLEQQGLLAEVEDREIDLAHSDRSKTPIEPYLADQWFVKMDHLAQSAMDAVTDGRVKILPPRYAKGYLDWLSEKRDWPISRQLWWGHRIPIWSRTEARGTDWNRLLQVPGIGLPGHAAGDQAKQASRDASTLPQPVVDNEYATRLAAFLASGPGEGQQTLFICVAPGNEELEGQLDAAGWHQEQDVLDTWFSSALWPHSTLGWPEQTPELRYYYPTSTLITSRDIITLWVARMVLMGLHNTGEVPFHEVFIHPKILDAYGETMSKSKGNGVDPLDVIDKFGADALRFGIAYLTTDTQDVRMPVQYECPHCQTLIEQTRKNRQLPVIECPNCGQTFSTQWATSADDRALPRGAVVSERFELARNFGNKLWNVARLFLIRLEGYAPRPLAEEALAFEDRWILSRLADVTSQVTTSLESYHYADAARLLYEFAWDEFCSLYAEMVKGRLEDPRRRAVAQQVVAHVLDNLLRLLHPMMPFLTERVWQLLGTIAPRRGIGELSESSPSLVIAPWPHADSLRRNEELEAQFATFREVLGALREIRSRQGIPPRESISFCVRCDPQTVQLLTPLEPYFERLARASGSGWGRDVQPPATAAHVALKGIDVYVDLKDFIDVEAEIQRNRKQESKLLNMIAGKEKKLGNENFVSRAPAEVVAKERASLVELQKQLESVREALQNLT